MRGPEAGGPSYRFSSTVGARLAISFLWGGHYVSKRARGPDVLLCPVHSMAARPVGGRACTRSPWLPGIRLLKYIYNSPDLVFDTRHEAVRFFGNCYDLTCFFGMTVLNFMRR